jgi:DNA-binding transcriptional ArsR family regulator
MNFRTLKKEVVKALKDGDMERILSLSRENPRTVSILINRSYDKNSLLTWRAVTAIGKVVDAITEHSLEEGRNIVRRLIWSITEESGGFGWSTLEMLGEIIRRRPEEFGDIALLIPEYFEEEIFRPGVLYALCRIGSLWPGLIDEREKLEEMVLEALRSADPQTRGYALYTIGCLQGMLDSDRIKEYVRALSDDPARVKIFGGDELHEYSIAELAKRVTGG